MTEHMDLSRQVISELAQWEVTGEYQPTADTEVVWVLSAPGTVEEGPGEERDPSGLYTYDGVPGDLMRVYYGIDMVYQITALRLNKDPESVTKEDVAEHGPILFYNGESQQTPNYLDLQNEAFGKLVDSPDFPVPRSKVVIGEIDAVGTPAQSKGLAKFLREANIRGKVVPVTIAPHMTRVGRYLEKDKLLFPIRTEFDPAPMPETHNPYVQAKVENDKILRWVEAGHLAAESIFKTQARMKFVRQVIQELRELKTRKPFEPTADIDIVWVLSNPGTVYRPSQDGIYKGDMADLRAVNRGIDLVRQITALRIRKPVEEITPADIEAHGPTMYYNGEDEKTANVNYPQNQDLEHMISRPDSPVPRSKVVIGHIDRIGTPAQVEDISRYLDTLPSPSQKIAVVTSAEHSVRVSRYLQHYRAILQPEVVLLNACFAETSKAVGKTKREVEKVAQYAEKGDLSHEGWPGF